MAGFLVMYYLGYSRGRTFFAGRRGTAKLDQAERWLSRYGIALILGNRFFKRHSVGHCHRRWSGTHALADRRAVRRDRYGCLEWIAALRRNFGG